MLKRMDAFYCCQSTVEFNRFLLAFFDLLWFLYAECEEEMDRRGRQEQIAARSKQANVQTVLSLIEQQYRDPLTLDTLERQLYMSKHHLSRLFREMIGMTIMDYLCKYRINQAKILFHLDRSCAVTDVCRNVGFHSMSHFSRLFKKYVGMTPEQYRKRIQPFLLEPLAIASLGAEHVVSWNHGVIANR